MFLREPIPIYNVTDGQSVNDVSLDVDTVGYTNDENGMRHAFGFTLTDSLFAASVDGLVTFFSKDKNGNFLGSLNVELLKVIIKVHLDPCTALEFQFFHFLVLIMQMNIKMTIKFHFRNTLV